MVAHQNQQEQRTAQKMHDSVRILRTLPRCAGLIDQIRRKNNPVSSQRSVQPAMEGGQVGGEQVHHHQRAQSEVPDGPQGKTEGRHRDSPNGFA